MTIKEIITHELPFVSPLVDDPKIVTQIEISQTDLQIYLNKSDSDVYDESTYTALEKLLVGRYSAYYLLINKSLANLGGVNGGEPNEVIKKAKADVVEVEFQSKTKDNSLVLDTEMLTEQLRKLVCDTASTLNKQGYQIRLPMCGTQNSCYIPFIIFK
jgi:hypothetical protein